MEAKSCRKNRKVSSVILTVVLIGICVCISGCGGLRCYSNESLYRQDIKSVCLDMFDNRSFYRDVEYGLSDALAKRIEAQTPYKIISDKSVADSVIGGELVSISRSSLSVERETGAALEKEVILTAVVNWKDLKTGELIIDNQEVTAMASYSEWQSQGIDYGSALAANKLAMKIVELMEKGW